MATQTLTPNTDVPPSEGTAFLRIALLMAGTVAVITLIGTFSGEKLNFLYKDQLHLTAGGMASLAILLLIPNYLRPFIGAGSDFFPLLGYHRRSYYALAALLGALGFFCLSALPHYTYLTTALLVIVAIAGNVTLMIMADAVMVTVGNRAGTVGRIQAVQQFTPSVLVFIVAPLGGYVTQHWSYAHCFRVAALTALFALPLTFLIDEKRVGTGRHEREAPEEHAARLEAKRAERTQTAAAPAPSRPHAGPVGCRRLRVLPDLHARHQYGSVLLFRGLAALFQAVPGQPQPVRGRRDHARHPRLCRHLAPPAAARPGSGGLGDRLFAVPDGLWPARRFVRAGHHVRRLVLRDRLYPQPVHSCRPRLPAATWKGRSTACSSPLSA